MGQSHEKLCKRRGIERLRVVCRGRVLVLPTRRDTAYRVRPNGHRFAQTAIVSPKRPSFRPNGHRFKQRWHGHGTPCPYDAANTCGLATCSFVCNVFGRTYHTTTKSILSLARFFYLARMGAAPHKPNYKKRDVVNHRARQQKKGLALFGKMRTMHASLRAEGAR